MNTCLELGENFGVKQEVLESYRDSGKMPEEVCLELLDMWQKAGQVSSQDIENLSMAGILGIQKELAAKEMKADISFADSRKDNPANMTMSKNTLT
jgi:hypothetical protein